jgi:hypothetical protein
MEPGVSPSHIVASPPIAPAKSIRVIYDTGVELPQLSVVVTVIIKEHSPSDETISTKVPEQLSVAVVAMSAADSASVIEGYEDAMVPIITIGGVLSILVLYDVIALLPHSSVAVTVIIAEQSPTVEAVFITSPIQLSLTIVAAIAAISASLMVG